MNFKNTIIPIFIIEVSLFFHFISRLPLWGEIESSKMIRFYLTLLMILTPFIYYFLVKLKKDLFLILLQGIGFIYCVFLFFYLPFECDLDILEPHGKRAEIIILNSFISLFFHFFFFISVFFLFQSKEKWTIKSCFLKFSPIGFYVLGVILLKVLK